MPDVRSALITGAAGGIGQALCEAFARAKYRVVATDLHTQARGGDFLAIDLSLLCSSQDYREQSIDRILKAVSSSALHVLVNNAAMLEPAKADQCSSDSFQETLRINTIAPFILSQALLPELSRGKGSIINIASIHGSTTQPGFISYATSKSALIGLTRAMAVDVGGAVRINAISPAATDTPMLRDGLGGDGDEQWQRLASHYPLGRIAQPLEIAEVAVFLASEQASFVHGANITVDGGMGACLRDTDYSYGDA